MIKFPENVSEWKQIAKGFADLWHFETTLEALDGKHIRTRCPDSGDSKYFRYKKYYALTLLSLVDTDNKFLNMAFIWMLVLKTLH